MIKIDFYQSRHVLVHSYLANTHNVIKAESEIVIIQLNQQVADNGEEFRDELRKKGWSHRRTDAVVMIPRLCECLCICLVFAWDRDRMGGR